MKKIINGKEVNIPDEAIDKLVETLGLSIDEAITTWLEDEGYEVNEVVDSLTKKAKDNRITATIHQAQKGEKTKRNVVRKEDPDKEMIIAEIDKFIRGIQGIDNVKVENIGKLITFSYNGNDYKLDLIKKRPAK